MPEDFNFETEMISLAASAAQKACACGDGVTPEENGGVISEGASFTIPLVVPIGKESGDGRVLLNDSLSLRDFPLPLLWQEKTGPGHDGSYLVGRIDSADITENGIENAKGVFDTGPWGREAERLVRGQFLRGVSVDLDRFETLDDEEMSTLADETNEDLSKKLLIKKARGMAATLVPKPAFQECSIILDETLQEIPIVDGIHTAEVDFSDDPEAVVSTIIASAIPIKPPTEWFDNPRLDGPTPLTVDEGGRVYGHIASWAQDHISYNNGTRPPRSKSNYAYFHTGIVKTNTDEDVAVGQLTLAGGHADMMSSAAEAVRHYDDTASAVADVHAGEDAYGIWVAGALRPGVTPEQIRTLRASAPSGDWRPIGRTLELVAVCQVNVPGFPVARACVASGAVTALVAGGAGVLYQMKQASMNKVDTLEQRIDRLETEKLLAQKEEVSAKFNAVREQRQAALTASANELRSKFAPIRERRLAEREALLAQKEELLNTFALKYAGKQTWDEMEHPRDRGGKFRDVLFKLSELLDGDDSGATEALSRAADAEEAGDDTGAVDAAREARVSLNEALNRVDDEGTKNKIKDVLNDVEDVLGEDSPKGSNEVDDALDEALEKLVEFLIDELGEEVDPQAAIDRAFAQLKQYVDSSDFTNPEDVLKRIVEIIQKQLQPNFAQ